MVMEIESASAFSHYAKHREKIKDIVFQSIDLTYYEDYFLSKKFKRCVFLGCELTEKSQTRLLKTGNFLFPRLDVPFRPYRNKLYNRETLYDNFDYNHPETYKETTDYLVYKYFEKNGRAEPSRLQVSLAQRLHDHAITDAMQDYLYKWESRKVVAIMGGHSLPRDAKDYKKVVLIAKKLAEKGHLLVSGGGPGGMEATHLGAWLASRSEDQVDEAIEILSKAPLYNDELWLSTAFQVIERFPLLTITESLGIPTWFYGHEPPTPFATHIAKYFANSVREEGLLAIAKGGVIFAPGSAGTIQEIFQEAAQNHYVTFGNISPMVFLNKDYWEKEKPVYPLLKLLAKEQEYGKLISISDEVNEIVEHIEAYTNK